MLHQILNFLPSSDQLSSSCIQPSFFINYYLFYFRVDYEGQVATASTMCRILSAIPTTSQGPAKIIIYDIHALQV